MTARKDFSIGHGQTGPSLKRVSCPSVLSAKALPWTFADIVRFVRISLTNLTASGSTNNGRACETANLSPLAHNSALFVIPGSTPATGTNEIKQLGNTSLLRIFAADPERTCRKPIHLVEVSSRAGYQEHRARRYSYANCVRADRCRSAA